MVGTIGLITLPSLPRGVRNHEIEQSAFLASFLPLE
jgi:hypothetical protein